MLLWLKEGVLGGEGVGCFVIGVGHGLFNVVDRSFCKGLGIVQKRRYFERCL